MIIFTNNRDLIYQIDNPVIFNLSSFYSGYNNITALITKVSISNFTPMSTNEFVYSPQFDNAYMSSIFSNLELYGEFMKIMINAYEGNNVIILVERDEYRDAVMESLIKLIQVRYGYNCWLIEDIDDLMCIKESFFTASGLINLDADIKNYDYLCTTGKIVSSFNNICKE